MTEKKCPNCKSRDFLISNCYETYYLYYVKGGVVHGDGTGDMTKHVRTICTCDNCGHVWHPRNLKYSVDE